MNDAEIVRAWLEGILEHRGWAAERLAREAGVAPTTLTRFLHHQTKYMPSWRTVSRVARAARVDPPRLNADLHTAGFQRLNLYYPDDVRTHIEVSRAPTPSRRTIVVRDEDGSLAFAAIVSGDSYVGGGVYPGDMVLCTDTPLEDKPVLAKVGHQLCVYRLRDGWLLPQSTAGHEPIRADTAYLLGRVERVERQVE